jgi:hypothetical protein
MSPFSAALTVRRTSHCHVLSTTPPTPARLYPSTQLVDSRRPTHVPSPSLAARPGAFCFLRTCFQHPGFMTWPPFSAPQSQHSTKWRFPAHFALSDSALLESEDVAFSFIRRHGSTCPRTTAPKRSQASPRGFHPTLHAARIGEADCKKAKGPHSRPACRPPRAAQGGSLPQARLCRQHQDQHCGHATKMEGVNEPFSRSISTVAN